MKKNWEKVKVLIEFLYFCFAFSGKEHHQSLAYMDPSRVPPGHTPFISAICRGEHSILGATTAAVSTALTAAAAAGVKQEPVGQLPECTAADDREYGPNAEGELDAGCRRCNVVFGTAVELKLHFGAVHHRTTFECFVCNKLYLQKFSFMAHLNRCHSELANNFQCSHCSKSYTSQARQNKMCS